MIAAVPLGRSTEPDTDLRDHENVPLREDIHEYFEREVRPHVLDAWIDTDLKQCTNRIKRMIEEISA